MRSTVEFDLVLDIPKTAGRSGAQTEGARAARKEHRQLRTPARRRSLPRQGARQGRRQHSRQTGRVQSPARQDRTVRAHDDRTRDVIDAIRRALEEDIGTGDVTSTACVRRNAHGRRPLPRPRAAGPRRRSTCSARSTSCAAASTSSTSSSRTATAAPMATSSPTVRGTRPHAARMRARRAEFPAAPERRRHARPPVRRRRRRHQLPRPRHPQDHARPARAGKSRPPPPAASPTTAWACSTPS